MRFSDLDREKIALTLAGMASRAGVAVMDVYAAGGEVKEKGDGSPVTVADERAEALIIAELQREFPSIPIVAEEAVAGGQAVTESGGPFFLVDPLDGTKEFISRNGEFTVNIALVEDRIPVAGVVYAPALARMYFGGTNAVVINLTPGQAIDRNRCTIIKARARPEALTAVVSRSHADPSTEAFLAQHKIGDRRNVGSSLKFCLIAAGEADVYPRLAPTMEWDTAAGHAVLLAAGGHVLGLDGNPLPYGKYDKGLRNPSFIAWGRT